jgi:hypothetical protein
MFHGVIFSKSRVIEVNQELVFVFVPGKDVIADTAAVHNMEERS